jgi:hypothetical protein
MRVLVPSMCNVAVRKLFSKYWQVLQT